MRLRALLLTLCGVLVLAGCASAHNAASPPGSNPTSFQPMLVTSVRVLDETHVRVTTQVPAPLAQCVHHLTGRVTDSDAREIFVQLTYTSPPPAVGVCAKVTHTFTVVAVPAVHGRLLGIDNEAAWGPVTGSSIYRHCTGPFGCSAPPRNHCDPAWLTLAGHSGELQPERSYRTLGCNQRWLVMNINATVTGCQPLDGASAPSGCRVDAVRWFFQFQPTHGWVMVAQGDRAGCASVHETVPAFSTALCDRLPAR